MISMKYLTIYNRLILDSQLSDDFDCSTELWTMKFLDRMKECIYHRNLSLKTKNLPRVTKNITKYMQKLNIFFQKAKLVPFQACRKSTEECIKPGSQYDVHAGIVLR